MINKMTWRHCKGSLAPAPPKSPPPRPSPLLLPPPCKADYYAKRGRTGILFFSSIPPTQLTQPRVSQACWTIMSQTNSTLLMPCRARARSPLHFFFMCFLLSEWAGRPLSSAKFSEKKKGKKKRKPCVLGISIDAKRGTLSKTMNNSRPARDNRCRARWSSVPTWQQRERKGKHALTWGRRRIFGST